MTSLIYINQEIGFRRLIFNQSKQSTAMITLDEVIQIVSDYYELDINILKNKQENGKHFKAEPYPRARHFISYWCKNNTALSLNSVGKKLDGMHHTSILHGIQKTEDNLQFNAVFRKQVKEILSLIHAKELSLIVQEV